MGAKPSTSKRVSRGSESAIYPAHRKTTGLESEEPAQSPKKEKRGQVSSDASGGEARRAVAAPIEDERDAQALCWKRKEGERRLAEEEKKKRMIKLGGKMEVFCTDVMTKLFADPQATKLMEWYGAAGGKAWKRQSMWLRHEDLAKWDCIQMGQATLSAGEKHVACGLFSPKAPNHCKEMPPVVVNIVAKSNNIRGTFPEGFFPSLRHIQVLELSNNVLTGEIPPTLAALKSLKFLSLAHNELSGNLPPAVFNHVSGLNELVHLDLAGNFFGGELEALVIGFISGMKSEGRVADLSKNMPGFTLPDKEPAWSSLSSLEQLNLFNCSLVGEIPSHVTKLAKLKVLRLCGNVLSGSIPPNLDLLRDLELFVLRENNLSGPFPVKLFGRLFDYGYFDFAEGNAFDPPFAANYLSGKIISSLNSLKDLRELDLRGMHLKGLIIPEIGYLPQAKYYDLGNNELSGPVPFALSHRIEKQEVHVEMSGNKNLREVPLLEEYCAHPMYIVARESIFESADLPTFERAYRQGLLLKLVEMPLAYREFLFMPVREEMSTIDNKSAAGVAAEKERLKLGLLNPESRWKHGIEADLVVVKRAEIAFISHTWHKPGVQPDREANSIHIHLKKVLEQKPEIQYVWMRASSTPIQDRFLFHGRILQLALRSSLFYIKCCEQTVVLVQASGPRAIEEYNKQAWLRMDRLAALVPLHDEPPRLREAMTFMSLDMNGRVSDRAFQDSYPGLPQGGQLFDEWDQRTISDVLYKTIDGLEASKYHPALIEKIREDLSDMTNPLLKLQNKE
jgi:hypothetical protein